MRHQNFFATLFCASNLTVSAQQVNPPLEEVARCFFIYAAITEVGRDLQKPQLFQFGQSRSSWAGGFLQANQDNPQFKKVFESNLQANKQLGIRILDALPQIIRTKDIGRFTAILNQAAACDRTVGIRTAGFPPIE